MGFSSFGVLIYYAVANASAYTQPAAQRRWPRAERGGGLVGCLLLIATLPWQSVVVGLGVFAIGLTGRAIAQRFRHRPAAQLTVANRTARLTDVTWTGAATFAGDVEIGQLGEQSCVNTVAVQLLFSVSAP